MLLVSARRILATVIDVIIRFIAERGSVHAMSVHRAQISVRYVSCEFVTYAVSKYTNEICRYEIRRSRYNL